MMTQPQKRRLGRGLAALIGDDTTEEAVVEDARTLRHVPIEFLHANPNNPRKHFADSDLEDLTRSIRDKGLLQPLVVRQRGNASSKSSPANGAGARLSAPACTRCRC